jgi:NTE family protein
MSDKTCWRFLLAILFLFYNQPIHAATSNHPDTIKNMVFGGGGTWGIAYGGALTELEKNGALAHLERVAGTSVGAIAAMTLAIGYTPEEVSKIIYDLRVDKFNDGGFPLIVGFVQMGTGFGWYRGNSFLKWLDKILKAKTGNGNLTFAQLHQLAKNRPYLDLYITGTNMSRQKMMVFSYETFPEMKIKDAVRISMCVPFYFMAVMMDKNGHIVKKSTEGHPADVMVDGGVINNFPIDIFDKRKFIIRNDTSSAFMFNKETIGMRVQRDSQIAYDEKEQGLAPYDIHTLKDFIISFYTFTLEKLNKESREPENLHRTIPISTLHYSQRVRHISIRQKTDLQQSGRQAVLDYYSRKK